jgi:hypothetical protein
MLARHSPLSGATGRIVRLWSRRSRASGAAIRSTRSAASSSPTFSVAPALPGKIDALREYLSGSAPWLTFEETDFARYMDRWPDIAVNTVMQVGHNTLRGPVGTFPFGPNRKTYEP